MKTTNLIKAIFIVSMVALISSCSKDDNGNKTAIKFKATNSTNQKAGLAGGVALKSFLINISEIEFEFDDNDPMFATDSFATDYELKGPFEIDLMKDGKVVEEIIASNVNLPVAAYDEIEFEFDKNKNEKSVMFGKTVIITGTINGKSFTFWTDEEMELEIEFDKPILLKDASSAMLTVSFDVNALFNPAAGGIDISSATDGNGDGIIDINPKDEDGNSKLAKAIYKKLDQIIEAFEDKYDN